MEKIEDTKKTKYRVAIKVKEIKKIWTLLDSILY